jgi:hypothetical protein
MARLRVRPDAILRSSLLRFVKHRDRGSIGISGTGTLMGKSMEKAASHAQGCDADKLLGICGSTFFLSIPWFRPSAVSRGCRTGVGTSTFGRPLICPLGPDCAVPVLRHEMDGMAALRVVLAVEVIDGLARLDSQCRRPARLEEKKMLSEMPTVLFRCQVRGAFPGFR